MSVVRYNLMNERGYAPYCGASDCARWGRTEWDGGQFRCVSCGWRSEFPADFIEQFKAKWGMANEASAPVCPAEPSGKKA